jgi:hypothetical protein
MPKIMNAATTGMVFALLALLALAPRATAQGSRKDDIVFGPSGHPIANATVRVCQSGATGTPCTPLATLYTDATLTTTSPNPFQTDGIGNYHFYAPAARYVVQISAPSITGTITNPDVILAPDASAGLSGTNISAFGLTLGGNLSVAGNATVSGTLTTSTFSPSTFAPGALQVTGNGCFGGPRPYIDVTCPPYGAKGDGTTDDTTAITNAINAACARPLTLSQPPTVAFPPGYYVVHQTQGSSTSPILPSCSVLHLMGMGNGAVMQFGNPPQAYISVVPGASPSAAPVFGFSAASAVTLENIGIDAYNQAVSFSNGGSNYVLNNVCLRAQITGQADNTPLKISNSIWFWMRGGCLQFLPIGPLSSISTLPVMIMAGDSGAGYHGVALVFVSDVIMTGGPVHYTQRANIVGAPPGLWVFRNITREDSASDFILITNDTGNLGSTAMEGGVDSITIEQFQDADTTGGNGAVVNFNASNAALTGVTINHAIAGGLNAIEISGASSTLTSASIAGCATYCATGVVDGSGNPFGGATRQNYNGYDFSVNVSDMHRLRTDLYAPLDKGQRGPAWRLSAAGANFAQVAGDPVQGILFGDGLSYGWTAQLTQSATETLDIGFSKTLPPTGVAAAVASGGTIPAGTYYYFVVPVFASPGACTSIGAGSLVSNPVTTTSGNATVNISWTPSAAGATPIVGYCVARNTIATTYNGGLPGLYVSGAGATGATDTGSNFTPSLFGPIAINVMQAQHRFTPTSLGINTTSPQYNLDVNGAAAVNSLNSVQMAERFTGSDAAAKINACLTAASTSSGI